MVRLLVDRAHLAPEQAAIVIGLATSKIVHVRGTEDYLVSREVAARATIEEKRALIDGLYAVCAADGLISTIEDNDVRRVASEIDLEHHDVVDIRASTGSRSRSSRAGEEASGARSARALFDGAAALDDFVGGAARRLLVRVADDSSPSTISVMR